VASRAALVAPLLAVGALVGSVMWALVVISITVATVRAPIGAVRGVVIVARLIVILYCRRIVRVAACAVTSFYAVFPRIIAIIVLPHLAIIDTN